MKDRIAPPHTHETDEQSSDLNELINGALLCFDDENDDADIDFGLDALLKLYRRADAATLAAAVALCKNADDKRRRVGAAILGQLGHTLDNRDGVFREERYRALEELFLTEMATTANPKVLANVCSAFGNLGDRRAVPIALQLIDHPRWQVRFDVVMALKGGECPKEEAAIVGLIKLSTDDDVRVRDWATFGLGQYVTADTVAIRTALYARLTDDDDQTIVEAIKGLARRNDATVLADLNRALREQAGMPPLDATDDRVSPSPICAALLEARRLLEGGDPPVDIWSTDWLEAMDACGYQFDINELIKLSTDDDAFVRDWATSRLGTLVTADTVVIRTTLVARLADDEDGVIIEAIQGLARRKDKTVLADLNRALREQAEISLPGATQNMAAPSPICAALLEARRLLEAQRSGEPPEVPWNEDWLEAMEACGCQLD